uniref:Lipoxygenase domain-containing protein n=2 Tax=Aegilops tauschii TaxID=37682 RepID=A0A453MPJ3_AEGTS
NFSQYPYGGYVPNRPSIARINMPSEIGPDGMRAYMEAPDKVLLDTFPSQYQSALVMAILDVLSSHSSGEEYLGTYQEPAWQQNGKINNAFEDFRERMLRIAVQVNKWNRDPERKNRCGPGMVPYVQLRPSDGDPMAAKTVMGMGVPTSISI